MVSASELVGLFSSDPKNWLWSHTVQRELFSALPRAWSALTERARSDLEALILQGPPREMFKKTLDREEWERIRDHEVWERLARLVRGGATLSKEASERVRELESEHPEWRLTGAEVEDFPFWMDTRVGAPSDYTANDLLRLDLDSLVDLLLFHDHDREGLLDNWHEAATRSGRRGLDVLARLQARRAQDSGVIATTLSALHRQQLSDPHKADLLSILRTLRTDLSSSILTEACHAVSKATQDLPHHLEDAAWDAWDTLFERGVEVRPSDSPDRLLAALNSCVGVLASALFHVLRSKSLERGSGLPSGIKARLEMLLDDSHSNAGLVIVASRLAVLHDLDPEWTLSQLLPLFDWTEPARAREAWQGFLWSPVVRPSLWRHLKQHFLETFGHLAEIAPHQRNLAILLTSVAIDGEGALDPTDARRCLKQLDGPGRGTVAWGLMRRLDGAAEKAAALWRERVGPWLGDAWPLERRFRDVDSSASLAMAAIRSGEAFPEAVRVVAHLIAPLPYPGVVVRELKERSLPRTYPSDVLGLIDAIIETSPSGWFGDLGEVLATLESASPALANDRRFERLNEIRLRWG